MTFVPTPKTDLPTIADLHEFGARYDQWMASYLYWQQETNVGVMAALADLYVKVGGYIRAGYWVWADDAARAGTFHVAIGSGVDARTVKLSRIDADGNPVTLGGFVPGKTMVLMDDPAAPPVTAFRQYVVSSGLVDHGDWWQFDAVRVATFGRQDLPQDGTRIRLLFG
jgi:hypothetical protein